ncbi:MAG TPA: Crp/Fnr family transcriptional regulator [Edaphobacter sp.]|nr:Crp/Fnr family transcriptional regulator [Edaphobacter sp.]
MENTRKHTLNKSCTDCALRGDGFFCNLSPSATSELEAIRYSSTYPAGSLLFQENEPARGIFLLCSGQIKLSVSSSVGKTLTLRIAKPGEMLGLTASMSGIPYEASAETLHPCQIAFVRRDDFTKFINRHPEVYGAVIRQLNAQYNNACEQLRTVGLASSAHEKLARLLLQWSAESKVTPEGSQTKVSLTHEQIAECIGTTRETITRTLSEFKSRHLVTIKGATLMIPDREALRAVCGG